MDNSTRRHVGNLYQRKNGTWRARVTCGVKSDGTPRRESRTFDTKSAAEEWLVQKSVEMGARPDLGAGVTLRQAWKLFENGKGPKLAKKTMSAYRSQMRIWLNAMGDADISTISCADVQRTISTLTHENALHAKRALSSTLTYAVGIGLLAANPLHRHKFDIPSDEHEVDWDLDPFGAIEDERNVWGIETVMKCFGMIRGLVLEPVWLACVGAGLRVEEAMALRRVDVRRVEISGVEVTQLAIHHASTAMERRKATKTRQSVRVVSMLEPFGERYWEIAQTVSGTDEICKLSPSRQNKTWRNYFDEPPESKHAPKSTTTRGALRKLDDDDNPILPYLPLARMRNTHATLVQQAGVLDSINAAMHGHSEQVARRHYLRPDTTKATLEVSKKLQLVG